MEVIHLRAHTDYSLGEGAIKIKELAKICHAKRMPALGIADTNNLFGSLEFAKECSHNGIQPIIGCLLNIVCEKRQQLGGQHLQEFEQIFLIAKNDVGYKSLIRIASHAYLDLQQEVEPYIHIDLLEAFKDGIMVLCGGPKSPLGSRILKGDLLGAKSLANRLKNSFQDNLYIELMRHGLAEEGHIEPHMIELAYSLEIPMVATNDILFADPSMYEAQDALLCISEGRYLLEEDRKKGCPEKYFKSAEQMCELFADIPEAIANTVVIAKRCSTMPEESSPLLPRFNTASGLSEPEELRRQATIGLDLRLKNIENLDERKPYTERLNFELDIITQMEFPGYFLIVSDFIKWAKAQNIPVGPGRGSGVGSIVAWALDITALDPIRFGLLFERFLNPERVSMPDFDIDFCQSRRGEVIRYVMEKYGHDRVAQIVTFNKLQARAVLRDVGRVLQLSYNLVDRICKKIPNNPANPVTLPEAIALDKELQQMRYEDPDIDKLFVISLMLEGINRNVSTHAAGIVIADRPIIELVPLYKDKNSETPAVQYSLKLAEDAGLVKFDFLGLKTLTVIQRACELIKELKVNIDIDSLPLDDLKSYEMLARGETVGVFQFESPGMRESIRKLKPDKIEDLIALGSLYRPGPMDNIPSYIARKHGTEKIESIHPLLDNLLQETYGIIVYQEQVMEIARVLAGYTLGSADLLRRAMGKKIKSEMEAQREFFVSGAMKNGVNRELAERIFELVYKFASYGFNKSHAAAYAIISYQTAYLKANYPVEFFVASMNCEIDDTDKINMFIRDIKASGIKILLPDVNKSSAYFTVEDGGIRYGLGAIKNVGIKVTEELIDRRKKQGGFKDIFDFINRCNREMLNKRMLESMVKSGVFDSIYPNRAELFANIELLLKLLDKDQGSSGSVRQISLFDGFMDDNRANEVKLNSCPDWDLSEKLVVEFEAIGFHLSSHPLDSHSKLLAKHKVTSACNVIEEVENNVRSRNKFSKFQSAKLQIAGVISAKKIRSSPRGKYAHIQITDPSGTIEFAIFNGELLQQKDPILKNGNVIFIDVEARKDENGVRLVAEKIATIEEVINATKGVINISVKTKESLAVLKNSLSSDGKPIRVSVILANGERIHFNNLDQYRLSAEVVAQLKGVDGLEIEEEFFHNG